MNLAAIKAAGLDPMELISKETDEQVSFSGLDADEIALVRSGARGHHTQQQVLRVTEHACLLTEIEANRLIWEKGCSLMDVRVWGEGKVV